MLYLRLNKYIFLNLEKTRSHKYIEKKPDGKGGWIYVYRKTIADKFKEDRREFGINNAIAIMNEISATRNKPKEHGTCYNKSGEKIFYKEGDEKGINYTSQELKIMYKARLSIHNHPDGLTFSDKDFYLLLDREIDEMRAFGIKNGKKTNFSIKKIEKINSEKIKNFKETYRGEVLKNRNALQYQIFEKKITIPEANEKFAKFNLNYFLQLTKGSYRYEQY